MQPSFVKTLSYERLHFMSSAYRNRAFGNDQNIIAQIVGNGVSYFKNIFQIGTTIFVGWRAYRNEYDIHRVKNRRQIGSKMQTLSLDISQHNGFQAGLVNRNNALFQSFDFFFVDIHTSNIYTHFGKTSSRNQTDITCSDNCYIHNESVFRRLFKFRTG